MFTRVLFPLDASELFESALVPMRRLLHEVEGASAVALHVIPSLPLDVAERIQLRAQEGLGMAAEALALSGLPCEADLQIGDPAEKILEAVERHHADLVVMATHGRSGFDRFVRGSVAERVLQSMTVPLLLTNPRTKERTEDTAFRKILVPLDGSSLADEILPYVIALARSVGAEVTLLRVEPIEPYLADPLAELPFVKPNLWDPEAVRNTLEPQRQRLLDAGVDVETTAVFGYAPQEICALANEHDLVALSTHGRSGISRWAFGSVAERVLRAVERPVFVVRGRRD